MADNQGFSPAPRGDQELVYSTNVGDGTTAATGEVTPLYRELDAAGNAIYTQIDGSAYDPSASGLEMVDTKPIRLNIGTEVVALNGTAAGFSSIPANAVLAEVQVHVGEEHAIWTTTGTAPDPAAHEGRLTMAGNTFDVEGENEISNFSGMALDNTGSAAGTAANLYVEYFNVTEDGTYHK